jgi:hypothetical protein
MKPVTHLPLRHPLGIRLSGDLAARRGFGSVAPSQPPLVTFVAK